MAEPVLKEWIQIKERMDDDSYRHQIASLAIRQLPRADRELRLLAASTFDENIKIQGIRSFERAEFKEQRRQLAQAMLRHSAVTALVICLWAEARADVIHQLQSAAEAEGLTFQPEWGWKDAIQGYYDFRDIPKLDAVSKRLTGGKKNHDDDDIRLAALWLGRSLLASEPSEPQSPATPVVLKQTGESANVKNEVPTFELSDKPSETLLSPDNVVSTSAENISLSLDKLGTPLTAQRERMAEARNAAHALATQLIHAIDNGTFAEMQQKQASIQNALGELQMASAELAQILNQSAKTIQPTLRERPDLQVVPITKETIPADLSVEGMIAMALEIQDTIERIAQYDSERRQIWSARENALVRLADQQRAVAFWNEADATTALESSNDDLTLDSTLTALKRHLERINAEQARLQQIAKQYRDSCLLRIQTNVERVCQLETEVKDLVTPYNLEDYSAQALALLRDQELIQREQPLESYVQSLLVQAKQNQLGTLIEHLRADWRAENLAAVFSRLAKEQRNVEVLLLLCSSQAIHPFAKSLVLENGIVDAVLRAVIQIAPDRPLVLLNHLAEVLLTGWSLEEPLASSHMCLAILGANFAGECVIPQDRLWNLPAEFPLADMKTWATLWEDTLIGTELPIIREQPAPDLEKELKIARDKATQALLREQGGYLKLRSLQSRRHIALLAKDLIPEIERQFQEFEKFESETRAVAKSAQRGRSLEKIEQRIRSREFEALSDKALTDALDAGIAHHEIDRDRFHRQTALRQLLEIGESVRAYGLKLEDYIRAQVQPQNELYRQVLEAELGTHAELQRVGNLTLDVLAQARTPSSERSAANLWQQASQVIIGYCLNAVPAYALQLPHVIAYLTRNDIDLANLSEPLLTDLEQPVSAVEAAAYLIEQGATTQALTLNQYISLEQQNQALAKQSAQERIVQELQNDLSKIGGESTDLTRERALGRWGYITNVLEQRVVRVKKEQAAQARLVQSHQAQLRERWNALDQALSNVRSEMPEDSYLLIDEGLVQSRRAFNNNRNPEQVARFFDDIEYRLRHKAWSAVETRKAVDELKQALTNTTQVSVQQFQAEEVFKHLVDDDLTYLGFGPHDIVESEVGTRTELLRNWLRVRAMNGFQTEELKLTERQTIQAMFRYFSVMVKLNHVLTVDGKELEPDTPILQSYRKLQFPKTDALRDDCILIALPGSVPNREHVNQLELLLEEKHWLDEDFVLLFVPGKNENLLKRLRANYAQRRLVIIDEKLLLEMILANTRSRRPIDVLRARMLDAAGAQTVEVFHINQLVNERTAIFVGRERELEQIANSDSSHAIYGGRRIGKSSLMMAISDRLEKRGVRTIVHSFDGQSDCSDNATARELKYIMKLAGKIDTVEDLKHAIQELLDNNPDLRLAFLLDEIDKYIEHNPKRHLFIELLRNLAQLNAGRVRAIVVGFMRLYACLHDRSPYSASSNPWPRLFNDSGPMGNLHPEKAERIVTEGFVEILGWDYEHRGIPQRIVEHTGGHPAFVQDFCLHLQRLVGERKDTRIRDQDVQTVFNNLEPKHSFIAYVQETLEMNLDPISRYLIVFLAQESSGRDSFTWAQVNEVIKTMKSPPSRELVEESLKRLQVTGVVRERSTGYYEFSVPDYPLILARLGHTQNLTHLESDITRYINEPTRNA